MHTATRVRDARRHPRARAPRPGGVRYSARRHGGSIRRRGPGRQRQHALARPRPSLPPCLEGHRLCPWWAPTTDAAFSDASIDDPRTGRMQYSANGVCPLQTEQNRWQAFDSSPEPCSFPPPVIHGPPANARKFLTTERRERMAATRCLSLIVLAMCGLAAVSGFNSPALVAIYLAFLPSLPCSPAFSGPSCSLRCVYCLVSG